MNASRIIWGTICLALAVLLGILNVVLPPENLMFMIGDTNMPYVPPIILATVGIVLLVTARRSEPDAVEEKPAPVVQDPEKVALNKRLEAIAWGCFLILLGGFMFVPDTIVAGGVWSIAIGLIMLGLNGARYYYGIRMSGFTTFLGLLSLASGILELFGVHNLEGAILLIILGAYLILKPWFDQRQLFGKAEESAPTGATPR